MKLVEILARELKEWPGGAVSITQDYDGDVGIYRISNPYLVSGDKSLHVWHHSGHVRNISPLSKVADDANSAIVTRKMWQVEREKLKRKKTNADGWIRHRGRKCPVQSGTLADLKLRGGVIHIGKFCDNHPWIHTGEPFDVMYYRLNKTAEQPAIEPGVIHVDTPPNACEESSYANIAEAMAYIDRYHTFVGDVPLKDAITVNIRDQHQENPIAWRDRIREIDRTVEALGEERVSLIQRLEEEGFKLIDHVNAKIAEVAQAHEDASDWQNWEEGDLIESIGKSCGYSPGSIYAISGLDRSRKVVFTALDDNGSKTNGWHVKFFKFHSRPSA